MAVGAVLVVALALRDLDLVLVDRVVFPVLLLGLRALVHVVFVGLLLVVLFLLLFFSLFLYPSTSSCTCCCTSSFTGYFFACTSYCSSCSSSCFVCLLRLLDSKQPSLQGRTRNARAEKKATG